MMLKKITLLCLTFLMLTCSLAFARFFDDNPRYLQVGHDATTESYIDTTSIQASRYDPPYYIIQATVLTYDYANNTATGYVNNFFYDFKSQTVMAQTVATIAYDINGNPVWQSSVPNAAVYPTDRYSVNGKAADKAFFNCYNMTFYHTFTQTE